MGLSESGLSRRGALRGLGWTVAAAAGMAEFGRSSLAQDATPDAAAEVPPDFKVVLHAAQEQHWHYVLSNLKNLTREWPRAHLRVVVDGSAVVNLQGTNNLTHELAGLIDQGIELDICPNALKEHKIDPADTPFEAYVGLGGVVALVVASREGYVYVKP